MPIVEVKDAIKARVKKVAKKAAVKVKKELKGLTDPNGHISKPRKKAAKKTTAVKKKTGVKARKIGFPPAVPQDVFLEVAAKVADGKTAQQAVEEVVNDVVKEAAVPEPAKSISVYNLDEAMAKFKIEDPHKVKYVPRTEFVQTLIGHADIERPLEDVVFGTPVYTNASGMLRELAGQFRVLRDKKARLPKFGKWVSSMFSNDQDLMNVLSKAGQEQGKGGLVVSGDIIDILRCADGQLGSCLGAGGMFKDVPVAACEEAPGIFIAYINDPATGKMKCRSWLHHVKTKDGQDAVLAMRWYGQGGTHQMIADYMADRGVKLYTTGYYEAGDTKVQYHECFKRSLHWDLQTWVADGWTNATLVEPSNKLKKAA